MKRIFIKEFMLICLFAVPYCDAAADGPGDDKGKEEIDDSSWNMAVLVQQFQQFQTIEQQRNLDLENNQITAIPGDLNLPHLDYLDLENNQLTAIPASLNLPNLDTFILSGNQITAFPFNRNLHDLERLSLQKNNIAFVTPQIFMQFPRLNHLNLNQNPLPPENVANLRKAARWANRPIELIVDDVGPQYAAPTGEYVKGADE